MSIEVNDRRTRPTAISTGTPVPATIDADHVLVKPLTTYLEGSEHKGPHSEPYPMPRHHAEELRANRLAEIVEPRETAPVERPMKGLEVERPDATSRVPDAAQATASTVPALPGAQPVRPANGPIPPAATSDAPAPARRGRPPGRRS